MFLVGHVTKDGAVAGPRVLEHMVDAVLYLEGERYQHYRVLRAAKNRFGSTHELGVFEMTDRGLDEVAEPERRVPLRVEPERAGLGGGGEPRGHAPAAGRGAGAGVEPRSTPRRSASRTVSTRGGSRCCSRCSSAASGLRLGRHDVFVTVTGGLTLDEPGTDLGVALAVASSLKSRPVLERTLLVGEVSLAGEVRRVSRLEARVREAAQLGFRRAAVPAAQADEARRARASRSSRSRACAKRSTRCSASGNPTRRRQREPDRIARRAAEPRTPKSCAMAERGSGAGPAGSGA